MIPLAAGALAGTRCSAAIRRLAITSVTTDSRAAGPGALFCALEGERADGHEFLDAVRAAGAAAVLCRSGRSRPLAGRVRARGRRAADGARSDRPAGAACVGREGDRHRRIEWQDVHEGHARRALRPARADTRHSPQPQQPSRRAADAFRLEPEHALCICELGTSEVGELAELARIAEPGIGVLTNIAPEHLEFLGDIEGVAREEASLLGALPPGGDAVLPAHEPLLEPYRRADCARRPSASPPATCAA